MFTLSLFLRYLALLSVTVSRPLLIFPLPFPSFYSHSLLPCLPVDVSSVLCPFSMTAGLYRCFDVQDRLLRSTAALVRTQLLWVILRRQIVRRARPGFIARILG
jgi:hypothetical protein